MVRHSGQQTGQQRLLCVQAVLGLGEHPRGRTVDHRRVDLFATVRGQAVEEHRARRSQGEESIGHAVRREHGRTRAGLVLLSHRGPDVGVDDVGAVDDVLGGGGDGDPGTGVRGDLARPGHHTGVGCVPVGMGDVDAEPDLRAGQQQGMGDVVAVADVGQAASGELAELLTDGLQVGEGLAGVLAVGQRVHHRHLGRGREFRETLLTEGADHDRVHVAREHRRGVGDGLPPPQLQVARGQRQR